MSEERLNSLVEKYPEYSDVFQSIFEWIDNNETKNIQASQFYSIYNPIRVNISFYILNHENLLNTIYRVIDNDGTKVGEDFQSINDIPDSLDTVWGNTILKENASIVPFYVLNLNF